MRQKIYWLLVFLILIVLAVTWKSEEAFIVRVRQQADLSNFVEKRSLSIQCYLCPQECYLPEGEIGRCQNKLNLGGRLLFLDIPLIFSGKKNKIVQ